MGCHSEFECVTLREVILTRSTQSLQAFYEWASPVAAEPSNPSVDVGPTRTVKPNLAVIVFVLIDVQNLEIA